MAAGLLNEAEQAAQEFDGDIRNEKAFLTRGVYLLACGQLDEALSSFEGVLAEKRTNVVALMGKARIFLQRRQYQQALKLFQQVLQLAPNSLPDPRIGIGLCLWAMDHKDKARAAWERSLEVVCSKRYLQRRSGLTGCLEPGSLDTFAITRSGCDQP